MITLKFASTYNLPENIQYIASALVASITVSGKAFGKNIAKNRSTEIVHRVGILLNRFLKD